MRLFPLPANRTVLHLCDVITNFARDELPLLGAQAAIGANMVVDLQEELKELRALVTQQAATVQQAWRFGVFHHPARSGSEDSSRWRCLMSHHLRSALD